VRLPIPPPSPEKSAIKTTYYILRVSVGHYENFPVASILLPQRLRRPVAVIYAFARSADDFADEGDDPAATRLEKLDGYRAELQRIAAGQAPRKSLFDDVARIVREHDLPLQAFHDLLDAFSQDVVKSRYASFAEVLEYCRRSANPVGRLLLHLFKRAHETELAHSDAICTALQLINFWQDVALDWHKGRVYLPQDEMRSFGVREAHLAEQRCDAAWRALMKFQCDRTSDLMRRGAPLGGALAGRIGLEIRVTVQGGLRILEKLRQAGYDAFRSRPLLRWHDWPLLLWRA
jgi:squalene synthase HpnC